MTIARIIGGLVILVGVYLTFRRARATDENVRVLEEGQITERYTRAVEQLGSDKMEIRLGGIYALERIAKDSPRDHWPIMEILTAYIRSRVPVEKLVDTERQTSGKDAKIQKPSIDIEAALTVIRRRELMHENMKTPALDLTCVDLRGANLNGAHIEKAIVSRSDLSHSFFVQAHLDGSDFSQAGLAHAYFQGASLVEAEFCQSDLEGANLEGAIMKGVNFEEPTSKAQTLCALI